MLVAGRVQGVGFRHFAWRTAIEVGVVGWVRNRRDGRVEILVVGTPDVVERYQAEIARGPSYGRVDGVETTDPPLEEETLLTFEVRSSV